MISGMTKLDSDEFLSKITAHRRWLESKRFGARADFRSTDLSDQAVSDGDFRQALLAGASFRGLDLSGADFRCSDLSCADLSKTIGLTCHQLAGSDLSGAQLPETIDFGPAIESVNEEIRNAGKHWTSLLLLCAYCWLTMLNTTDLSLIMDSSATPLPIIGTRVPIVFFYWSIPFIALGAYVHLHIYLQRLWESIAALPAVFKDGRTLYQCVSPWLPIGIVSFRLHKGHAKPLPLFHIQYVLSCLLLWCVAPVTLHCMWGRCLRRHDWYLSVAQAIAVSISVLAGIMLFRIAWSTMIAYCGGTLTRRHLPAKLALGAFSVLVLPFYLALSYGAVNGVPTQWETVDRLDRLAYGDTAISRRDIRRIVPNTLRRLSGWPFARLELMELSTKPERYSGGDLRLVKGARLADSDIQYGHAARSFLVNADLQRARLKGIDLAEADLRNADLSEADLSQARLDYADLSGARIIDNRIRRIVGTANFINASMVGAIIRDANLSNANMDGADLNGADFRRAHLDSVSFRGASLRTADFRGADLSCAKFAGADLFGAKFQGADLTGTDFRAGGGWTSGPRYPDAKGLSRDQLPKSVSGFDARLPDYVLVGH